MYVLFFLIMHVFIIMVLYCNFIIINNKIKGLGDPCKYRKAE